MTLVSIAREFGLAMGLFQFSLHDIFMALVKHAYRAVFCRPYVAVTATRSRSNDTGIRAISYHVPRYLLNSNPLTGVNFGSADTDWMENVMENNSYQ